MEFNYYAEIIAAFVGAGAAVGAHQLSRLRKSSGGGLNEYAAQMLKDEIFELRQRINLVEGYNAQHIKKIAELERDNFELRHQIEIMKFAPFSIPLPMWMKNSFGVVDFVNDEYEKTFLAPRGLTKEDYLGKTDHAVWPREVAEEYVQNDKEVMQTGKTFNGRETVPDAVGQQAKWRIMKFIRKVPLGVAGIAFPDNGYFEKYFEQKKQ